MMTNMIAITPSLWLIYRGYTRVTQNYLMSKQDDPQMSSQQKTLGYFPLNPG